MPAQPRVFISHSSKDKPFVEQLAADLKANGCDAWLDKEQIGVGDSIVWAVNDGLRDSDFLVLAISQNSMASEWVRQEFESALMWQLGGRNIRVLPIRLDEAAVPTILAARKYADFTKGYDAALTELVAAIQTAPAPPTAATAPATTVKPAKSVRDWTIDMLEEMTSGLLSQVITRLPRASRMVNERNSPVEVASALMRFAESSAGPGLDTLTAAIEQVSGKSRP